ncbi:IclR family transcriptional regulator [Pararhodobacter sp.]|uniref:IclR family transcriptional regulator n=1 Tax=Pararhodobacter sp. TaxID=2127056 RepID=UPI002AFFB83F|nr:IclR family transcriptional regulator [Pararhodobacter sp.]
MRTVEKALRLLEHFESQHPEFGLSDLARVSGIDKATVLRMLTDLSSIGLVEQDPQSRHWRLGAGLLRLARLREAAFPVTRILTPILNALALETGETAHASLLSGDDLGTVGVAESQRTNRVHLEPGLILPLHATASGLAYTAYARPDQRAQVLNRALGRVTKSTPDSRDALATAIAQTRTRGYAIANQTFEDEVYGLAMPLFGPDGFAIGALAVASPASRITPEIEAQIVAALTPAALKATRDLGGRIPPTAA